MRQFFTPASAPEWLKSVLASIRSALSEIWPTPLRLNDYTTAALPPAADWSQGMVYDSTTGKLKYSDGTNWIQIDPYATTAASKLLGRGSAAGAGPAEEITLGTNLSMSGTTLNGAGSDPWTYLALSAGDYNNATATFTNITDGTTTLTWAPPADTNWEIEARILIWTTDAANLPRIGMAIAAGAARGYGGVNLFQAGATATNAVIANGAWANAAGVTVVQLGAGGVLTASVPYLCEVRAAGRSGATPTAISLQMACETAAAATCYVKRGSFMKYRTFA